MLFSQVHRFLTAFIDETSANRQQKISRQTLFWLTLSLGFAIYYGILGLQKAFRGEYVVQDDAREYVFWMQRFVNPELLPHDLIADYFKSITPLGFAAVYKLMASLGIDPLLLSKILPICLGLITSIYCFWLCLEIFPVPLAGFISTLLLNQSLWFKSDLVSATPKAFVYPLLLAFLYYILRKSWLAICFIILLEGLFYPPLLLICVGILFMRSRGHYLWVLAILGLAFIVMLPYAIASAEFGPVATASQAWKMPEYWPGGRHPFFDPNPWRFWLIGQHSGILPPLMPPLIWLGLLLPLVVKYSSRFPLINLIKNKIKILPQIIIVSLSLFFAAHSLLLKLFFPTRYTIHTLRIVMAIAAGIALTAMFDSFLRAYQQKSQRWQLILTVILAVVLLFYPNFSGRFPTTDYRQSGEVSLYKFLQQKPQDIMIATLADEADNIPTFTQRSILVGREYALPFHLGYYSQIRQRTSDLIDAQYSPDLVAAKQLIQKYKVSFWLVEHTAFQPEYLTKKTWLESFQPAFKKALNSLEQDNTPALAKLIKHCSVLETEQFTLLKTECIVN
ncbi:hypothetical protein I8751_20520 [Nostocaceae cyanobacterium CENA357]|uniref:Uncharacterized protein n=1 Tax=Atlanticothrix silvestris CENA357 TaxID=1725252 RepID=A0A8J7HGI9_9CYAN|nr:hypothetical protein [Atlanticothrix silvestris]MBH8554699.1 hypothetical protein [Atlanticothrix silvestris CENA357]